MPILRNARHERYAQGLADGLSQADAYAKAGFSANRGHASSLLKREGSILKRRDEILAERETAAREATAIATEAAGVNKAFVMTKLVEVLDRSLQAKPVLDDEGNVSGEWTYRDTAALKALDMLGTEIGMFVKRSEVGQPGDFQRETDDELYRTIEQLKARRANRGAAAAPGRGDRMGPRASPGQSERVH